MCKKDVQKKQQEVQKTYKMYKKRKNSVLGLNK